MDCYVYMCTGYGQMAQWSRPGSKDRGRPVGITTNPLRQSSMLTSAQSLACMERSTMLDGKSEVSTGFPRRY